jgi:hypothetical protein
MSHGRFKAALGIRDPSQARFVEQYMDQSIALNLRKSFDRVHRAEVAEMGH